MLKDVIYRNTDNKNKKHAKNILIIGVFHGDEPQGEYFINQYIALNLKNLPFKNNVMYLPRLNKNTKRVNKNGVDLNRNFPAKNWEKNEKGDYFAGSNPASEAETQMLVDLINREKFDAIITIHAPYKIINYDGDNNGAAIALAQNVGNILGYPVQKDIGYPTPGSFGTYCGVERDIPTITVEVDEEIDPSELLPKFKKLFHFLESEY